MSRLLVNSAAMRGKFRIASIAGAAMIREMRARIASAPIRRAPVRRGAMPVAIVAASAALVLVVAVVTASTTRSPRAHEPSLSHEPALQRALSARDGTTQPTPRRSAPHLADPGEGDSWRALVIDGHRVLWPRAGDGTLTLRYAIATTTHHYDDAINCADIGPMRRLAATSMLSQTAIRAAAAEAFARWQSVSALRFVEVDDTDMADGAHADIVIGEQLAAEGYAFTGVELGGDLPGEARAIRAAAICLNPERQWKVGFDGNLAAYDLVHTLTHEIGHAIGLDHPGARGHVMSFRYDETLPMLTDGDIRGVVALYGSHALHRRTAGADR